MPIRGDESQDITYEVGNVLTHWENIEGELSHIFALFVGKMWTNQAYDEYYAKGRRLRAVSKLCKPQQMLTSSIHQIS